MPYPERARRRRVPFSYGGGAPSPVTRVYADFGPSGKSVSFSSVTPDRIVMFVYPRSGNTGLPAGAPAVTNERFQTIDFSYSGPALTSIGSGFNGFIANIQLFSGSTLLLDEPVNNNDGLTYNGFGASDFRSFTQNADGDWLGVELWDNTPSFIDASWTNNNDGTFSCDGSQTSTSEVRENSIVSQGRSYRVSFNVLSISAGQVRARAGNAGGTFRNAVGLYVDTQVPSSADPHGRIQSDADFVGNVSISIREFLETA